MQIRKQYGSLSHATTGLAREKHVKGPERGPDDNADLQGVAN